MLARYLSVAVGAGILVGLALGYLVWGRESAALAQELAKTKTWLLDEIKRSDAAAARASETTRPTDVAAGDLEKAQARLRAVQADLNATRALLKEAVDDWKGERKRRRDVEVRLAMKDRECPDTGPPRR